MFGLDASCLCVLSRTVFLGNNIQCIATSTTEPVECHMLEVYYMLMWESQVWEDIQSIYIEQNVIVLFTT